MKKNLYLPVALLGLIVTSCSMHNNNAQGGKAVSAQPLEKQLSVLLQVEDTLRAGSPAELTFTVYNRTDSVRKFLKWQTPFEPLMSKYLDIKNEQGEDVPYKGPMAKRLMPPPADAYLTLNPKDSLFAKVDILKGYDLAKAGKYTVTYTSEGVSGLKVSKSVTFVYQP
jgi:hypothetical protein